MSDVSIPRPRQTAFRPDGTFDPLREERREAWATPPLRGKPGRRASSAGNEVATSTPQYLPGPEKLEVKAELVRRARDQQYSDVTIGWNTKLPQITCDGTDLYLMQFTWLTEFGGQEFQVMRRPLEGGPWIPFFTWGASFFPAWSFHQPPAILVDDNRRLHLIFDVSKRAHHIVFSRRDSDDRLLATESTNSNEWTTPSFGYQGATTDGQRTYWTMNTPAWLQVQQSWPRQPGNWTDFAHPRIRPIKSDLVQLFYPLMAPLPSGPSPDMLTAFAEQIGGRWPGMQLDWSDRSRRRLVRAELHRAPVGSRYTVRATPCDLEYDGRGGWHLLVYLYRGANLHSLELWSYERARRGTFGEHPHRRRVISDYAIQLKTFTYQYPRSLPKLQINRRGTMCLVYSPGITDTSPRRMAINVGWSRDGGASWHWRNDVPLSVAAKDVRRDDLAPGSLSLMKAYHASQFDPDKMRLNFPLLDSRGWGNGSFYGELCIRDL